MIGLTNASIVLHNDAFDISFHAEWEKQKKKMDAVIIYFHINKKLTKEITYNVSLSLLNNQVLMI